MLALTLLAIGLAMDAVAAALAHGAASRGRSAVPVGLAFGTAQATMPLIGWSLGLIFAGWMARIDHWVALVLLACLGLRMIKEGIDRAEEDVGTALAGWKLVTAAVATSVDAAAAGVTLQTIGQPIAVSCFVIGLTTCILSIAGVHLGAKAGSRIGCKAEVAGGLLLLILGIKIFVQHQFLGG